MYIIELDEWSTTRYRMNHTARQGYQRAADQQMASRLTPVEIRGADGSTLYRNTQYKGATSDLEWHEKQTEHGRD